MYFVLQNIIQNEQKCGNPLFLFQRQDINLAEDNYDISSSEVSLSLKPSDESWAVFGQREETVVSTLPLA